MTTTKKVFLLVLAFCWMPMMLFAQSHIDSVTIYRENFDGSTYQATTSYVFFPEGDWHLDSSLSVSSPACIHANMYNRSGNMNLTTNAIPLSSTAVGGQARRVYMMFDHICKVNKLDNAYIYYRTATGQNSDGTYIWSSYKLLNFNQSSSFYYGDGKADPYLTRTTAHFGNVTAGKFDHECYGTGANGLWKPNTNNASPTNAWWRHEILDISSFVIDTNVTHIQIQFRLNKVSPTSSGTEVCAGWFIDNLTFLLSNCELEIPRIALTNPVYAGGDANCGALNNNLRNNTGPYLINASIKDNDTLDLNTIRFTYQKNSEAPVTITTHGSSVPGSNGHNHTEQWLLPSICYYDTIRYQIYVEDVHGNKRQLDTFLIAWHNQTNLQNNDCRADGINTQEFPHCFITGQAQPVKFYFTNKSDAPHSGGNSQQESLTVVLKVENENHQVTHNSTHNWTGGICMDISDSLSLGTFTPTRGFNYITAYITSRNGQPDGYHANDTIKYTGFACDSLLNGDYTVGGSNPDFADINSVKMALHYCNINGPVTFHLRPGTYGDFDWTEDYGQTAVNTITFQGDSRDNVIITNNHTDSGNDIYGAVTLTNAKHLHFKDLTITGKSEITSKAVLFRGNGSTDIAFDNCKIIANNTNTTDNTCFAIGRTAGASGTTGNPARPDTEIQFSNCLIQGGNYGVYYIGTNSNRNAISFVNNTIKSCYKGIHTYYCNPTLQGNHISQENLGSHQDFTGIYVEQTVGVDINGNTIDSVYDAEYGICLKNAAGADFFIRNNHVKVGNSNFGVYVGNSSSTSSASATVNGYLYNNEVILYPVTADNSYAVQLMSSNNLKVINNSLYIKSNAPYSNTAALMIQNNNNTYLDNNILMNYCNSGMGTQTNYPLYLNGTSTITGDNNDLISGSGLIAFKTVAINSIAELEQIISTTNTNVSVLPPMTDATESLLPLSFNGLECPRNISVLTDISGAQRTHPTHMGAYSTNIAAVDAAITSMVVPTQGACPEDTYDVTLNIANKGTQVLNFANNHATVTILSDSLNLNQQTPINSGTIAILGNLAQVVVPNIEIPVNQNIDFTFIINTTGDVNHLNDTLSLNFILEAAIPDYEEDFSNGTVQTWTITQLSQSPKLGNWTFQEGTGVNPEISPVYGTGRLFFNSKNFSSQTSSRIVMPAVDLSEAVNPILEIWFAHDNGGSANMNTEGVTVKVSTNGGTTFTPIIPQGQTTAFIKRYKATATTPEWQLYTFDLSNYVSQGCIHIAFEAASQQGSNINIDRVRLRNLVNNDIAVTQIYSHGETPTQYTTSNMFKALVRNEGRLAQSNIKVYLNVTGAGEQYHDSLTIASLNPAQETVVTFPDHHFAVQEVKNVEIRSRNDEVNFNNAFNWRMVTTENIVNYADTTEAGLMIGDYNNIIRPCVRYTTNAELTVKALKYYYDYSYIANPENGFRAFVSNSAGQILATSDIIQFSDLTRGAWNTIPINNFALTNMTNEFYVGIEMLAKGDYLCAQIETPLRDSAFYYLGNNGVYTPQTSGRFMIGALIDTVFQHDLAIVNLDNPTTRCDLGHEHITVTITNNGSIDLLPGTMMHYSVNGLAAVNEPLTDTLHSHETKHFAFNTLFDFTNNQIEIDSTYNILVWATKDPQDRLQYNDTIRENITSIGKSMTPIVQDTVDIHYYTSGTLTAHLPNSVPQGVIGWFANTGYESWSFLGYSDSTFQTPVIFFDTTFYANTNPGYIFDTVVGQLTGSVGNGTQPFSFTKGYSRGRMLYTENEIGQHGPITTIGVYVNSVANVGPGGIPIKIYLKETSLASFPSTAAIDWDNEILGASLIVDEQVVFDHTGWHYFTLTTPFEYNAGNLIVLTETNCADYCSGTGTQCYNCGQYVSGGTGYPTFRQTNCATGFVQYKDNNTLPFGGNYSNFTKRLTMSFRIADLACGSEKVPIHIHVPDIPTYDVQTISFDSPTTGCALYDEHVQVTIKNMLNTPIPAGKVNVHARFNGGTPITETINEVIGPEEVKVVTFTQTYDFSAAHANTTFNYVVYTTMNNEPIVYSGNDTITGSFTSNYTAGLQPSYIYDGSYTETLQILKPADRLPNDVQFYYFYDSLGNRVHTTTANQPYYTTPALYDSVVYWVEARTKTSTCTTRRVPIYINVPVPLYDLKTDSLVNPLSFQCGVTQSYPIQVQITNTDTTATSVIPAGTFNITAQFTGGGTANGTTVVNAPISSLNNLAVTFNNGVNIGSQTQNRIFNYTIFTNATDPSAFVYRKNDTIRGTLYVPAYPTNIPVTRTYTNSNYGQPYTINTSNFTNSPFTYYYFYYTPTDETPFAQGHGFTTDPLYDTARFYYSGRIESPEFQNLVTAGTGTAQGSPFVFNYANSYSRILYNANEMGGYAGRIDTIFVRIRTKNANAGTYVPVKIWMMNTSDTTYTTSAVPAINWNTETAAAKLVFDGNLAFDQTEWYAIPVRGGFDYTGKGLFIYTQHDCDGGSCLTNYGITAPQFYGTNIQKKVITKSSGNFQWNNVRWNTRFKFSYTCESPRGLLQINTTRRQHDLHVAEIILPVTPNNAYTNNEQVRVQIINHGKNNESNFPVKYSLNGQTPVTQNFSGTLHAGDTAVMNFNTRVNLSDVYFSTPFKVYTDLSTDNYRQNDTATIYLRKPEPTPPSIPNAVNAGIHITNVNFAGINNGNPNPFTQHPRVGEELYSDYTLDPAQRGTVVVGQRYPLSVSHSFETNATTRVYKSVYIDFNRNNTFENNERVSPQNFYNLPAEGLMFWYVDIPATAQTGLTRMRVIASNGTISPHGYYSNGETEDYAINILPKYEHDMGLSSYMHPVGDVCPDSAAAIRIWAKNYGTQTQTFSPQNPLSVTTNVRQGATVNTYTGQIRSGSVAPGDSTFIYIKPVDLSAIGSYVVSSQMTYGPDQYHHNDTLSTAASTDSLSRILSIPFFEDFDHNTGTTISTIHFTDDWILDRSHPDYIWQIHQGAAENNPNAGPTSDHTQANITGRYATVPGPGISNQFTTLTTRCINMHYNHDYPVELYFFKHFHGVNNANFQMIVEIGSGKHFHAIDTLTKADGGQTTAGSLWTEYAKAFLDFDEIAQLRFRIINHTGKVDPSIDDINVKAGLPSIKLESILYPNSTDCLPIGSVVKPQVVIRNVGKSPIHKFDLTTRMSVANDVEFRYDTINHTLQPNETMTYTLDSGFVLNFPSPGVDFFFSIHIDYEEALDTLNNKLHVISCTNYDIPEIEGKEGVVLMQNDPNPAITSTRIAYKLPEAGKTVLNIYSAEGQLIYTDNQEAFEGDNHYDVTTSHLAAGIYFYTLKFKDVILTKKMVIQK